LLFAKLVCRLGAQRQHPAIRDDSAVRPLADQVRLAEWNEIALHGRPPRPPGGPVADRGVDHLLERVFVGRLAGNQLLAADPQQRFRQEHHDRVRVGDGGEHEAVGVRAVDGMTTFQPGRRVAQPS